MSLTLAAISTQYIKTIVTRDDGSNPTGDSVAFAFLPDGTDPIPGNWVTGSWQIINGNYIARCLVGPNGVITLVAGVYVMWVTVTDNPEIPVQKVDYITVI